MNAIDVCSNHFDFDRHEEPVLTVGSGATVTFHTLDACCGEVRTVEQFLNRRNSGRRSGPLTGPVYIEGAAPGQTLVVDVVDVQLDPTGFQLIGPGRAIVKDEVSEWTCYEVNIVGDRIRLRNGVDVPVDPVIGTFGNAPESGSTKLANRLGGNQDVPAAKIGARLYIPIEVPGALFSVGDVHACQGDGEIVGAPEIGAKVTLRFTLAEEQHSEWCMIEDETHWHTACPGSTEDEATRKAVFHNAAFICRRYHVELKDALILLTMIGKLSISRTGTWGPHVPVVCSSFPKKCIEDAVANYHGDT